MGRAVRERPVRLSEKLLQIRKSLGLSQNGMIRRMGLEGKIVQADISTYEIAQREPPLKVLLAYARAANISVEAIIDDELDLPAELPSKLKSEGVRAKVSAKGRPRSRK
jgi:transcriptional regulator with XRE-family HTH domain